MDAPWPQRARRRGLGYLLLAVPLLLGGFPLHNSAWMASPDLHTWVETISTVLGLIVGIEALYRYYSKKSSTFLFIGTGFLGGALLDACHALVTSSFMNGRLPPSLSDFPPWSGIMSSIFISVLMCASLIEWRRERLPATKIELDENFVYLLVGIWFLVTFLFFCVPGSASTLPPRSLDSSPRRFCAVFLLRYRDRRIFTEGLVEVR
jgi:hypothetical protein